MRYESTDWSLEGPEGWSHESDEDCTTFEHPQGVGAFQVSSYRKEEAVTDDDLREFAGEIPLAAVALGRLTGFRTRFSEDDRFWTKWWLRAGDQMIHITYNCSLTDRGREDAEVSSMIESPTPKYDTNAA
jgi:hypothetical protein